MNEPLEQDIEQAYDQYEAQVSKDCEQAWIEHDQEA